MLKAWKECTFGEFQFGKGTEVLIRSKVRPEGFPKGLPMAIHEEFING
jgi:hypothetical protein